MQAFRDINGIISEKEDAAAQSRWEKPSRDILRENLSDLQYEVTQNGATERAFTGEYWNFDEKGIYVDITTGQPLFSSLDKFESSCGWPSFSAPIDKDSVTLHEDLSYGMNRTEVKSEAGDAHLGHLCSMVNRKAPTACATASTAHRCVLFPTTKCKRKATANG